MYMYMYNTVILEMIQYISVAIMNSETGEQFDHLILYKKKVILQCFYMHQVSFIKFLYGC